ncbi:hypothetical protein B0H11DRAFT_1903795 [Mycena galericulata]|nr:hypothetical protein B0H11DRAFT_1903795 [Mycena galericulata]
MSGPNFSDLDVLFTSSDPMRNILSGDLYTVFAHLDYHGIPSRGLGLDQARQALVYHLLSAIVARALGSSVAGIMSVLATRHRELVKSHSISNPLHDVFDGFERLSKSALTSLATLHGLDISQHSLEAGRNLIVSHVGGGNCGLHRSGFRHLGYASLLALSRENNHNLHVSAMDLESSSSVDFDLAQVNILASLMPKLSRRPLRRILQMHSVEFSMSDGTAALRKHLKAYLRRLRRGKRINKHWLQMNHEFDINLLRRPDYVDPNDSADEHDENSMGDGFMDVDSENPAEEMNIDLPPHVNSRLDPDCVPPPMPLDDTNFGDSFDGAFVDPEGIESGEGAERPCGKVPRLALSNHNYLGPVTNELKNLTFVEEAMIARCRAKCWIIQLKDEGDYSTPITQRGVCGPVVYPQKLSAIAKILPPSLEEVITPICVILVLSALARLSTHNPLYKDVEIETSVFDGLPDEMILPFHIQRVIPSGGIDATSSCTPDACPDFSDIVNPPASEPLPLESVVVANVDRHTCPNELRKAAIDHLELPGKNYVGIPHDKSCD